MSPTSFLKSLCIIVGILQIGSLNTIHAQILNVEKSRIKEDSANYIVGKAGLSFNLHNRNVNDDGNTENFIGLTFNGDIAYMTERHSYMLINYLAYTSLGNNSAIHTGYSHFRTNFFRKARISNEVFTQYQYDLGRGLDSRWLVGTGFRIVLVGEENTELIFGPGIMYEYERWESPEETENYRTARLIKSTNYLSIRQKINDDIDFNAIAYYQTGYDEDIDNFRHRITGDLNLSISVTEKLSLSTNFNCTFENRPIVPVPKFVFSITNGLVYNF